MFKRIIILIAFVFLIENTFSQIQGIELIDSLKLQLSNAKEDTSQARILGKLSFLYYRFDTDSGVYYGQKALSLSEKLKWTTGIAFSYNYLGTNFAVKGNFPQALDYFNKSLVKYNEADDQQGIAFLNNNLANFYRIHKEYSKAIEYINISISINSGIGNKYELVKNYINIGNIYAEKLEFNESNSYYFEALELSQEIKNEDLASQILINIADNKTFTKEYCDAIEMAIKALDISIENNITYDIAAYCSYIGAIYYKIACDTLKNSRSCPYYSTDFRSNLLLAKKYLINGLFYLEKIDDLALISETSQSLSQVYERLDDTKNALKYYKEYSDNMDSIFSNDTKVEIANIEKKQEVELRDKQIQIQHLTIEKKNSLIIAQIVIFILILLSITVILYFFYLKRKNYEAQIANQLRTESEKALIESEERLSRAEKIAKIGNWKLLLDSRQIIASHGAIDIYGIEKNQFNLEIVQKIPLLEYRETLDTALINLITKGTPYNVEFKIQRVNDGEITYIHSIATFDKSSNIVFGVVHDISEQKKYEQLLIDKTEQIESQNEEYLQLNEELLQINKELTLAKEHAEESDRLKTAFLQNMSHEIRTPMNAIMGFSALLKNNFDNKPKLEKFSEIINQRCNDLLDIINDILDIAKIESGQLTVNMEECDLEKMFLELASFFTEHQKHIEKEHIAFSLKNDCGDIRKVIVTDTGKLKQIFINLIVNAFKFTETGTIEAGCRFDENNKIIFFVSDTGIGIPPNKHDNIFERFTQLNPGVNKLVSGTGLGLSIVKGLINLLGGEINLKSQPGEGSTFSFTITSDNSKINQSKGLPAEPFYEKIPSERTILLVEDDPFNTAYLEEILKSAGYKIIHTMYGKEAVQIALSQEIDIVLMDVRIPDINGYEATVMIRSKKPSLKIIAQTAYASNSEKLKALEAGCNDYIAKPIKESMLLNMINNQLNT